MERKTFSFADKHNLKYGYVNKFLRNNKVVYQYPSENINASYIALVTFSTIWWIIIYERRRKNLQTT